MAKIDVKGKSIESLLQLTNKDLSSLSRSNLAKVVSRLASAGNKRIKRFGKETSPALESIMRSGGKFSVRGKTVGQLKKEFLRAKGFLHAETSTLKGAKKVKKEVQEKLKERGIQMSPEQYDKFFRTYERLKSMEPSITDKQFKYSVFEEIGKELESGDIDEITETIFDKLDEIYQKEQEYDTDFSKFFTID